MIQQSNAADSSFYHLEKINSNEFWAGGKYGILKKIDSLGTISNIDYPNEGLAILKIERINNYVFLLTENAVIYRYDIKKEVFIKKEFPSFKNKCFYDLIVLENGSLLVCGGATEISEAKKKLPKGFIALVDQELKEINVVWKNSRKFVWSLLKNDNQQIFAATYNGINTKILKSSDLKSWKFDFRVKGLVHELAHIGNQIWYCGTKNIRFQKDGIIGHISKVQDRSVIKDTGCLWSMDAVNQKVISVTQSGELFIKDKISKEFEHLKIPQATTLYDLEKISESKILVVGQGKAAYIIDIYGDNGFTIK